MESSGPRVNWRLFYTSWGGWTLDGFTAFIYAFVNVVTTEYLLKASGISLTYKSFFLEAFFAAFLLGWGTSVIFGPLSDKYGRIKILALSIVLFAIGSILSGIATNAYEFMVFRFIVGLGIGSVWFTGANAVAEAFPENKRVMGAGLFHTGYYFGFFFAAIAYLVLFPYIGFRGLLMLGALPVVFVAYIGFRTKEPERWEKVKKSTEISTKKSFMSAFSKGYLRTTIAGSIVLIAVITGLYGGTVYVPVVTTNIISKISHFGYPTIYVVAAAGAEVSLFTVIGCLIMPFLSEKIGRRYTEVLFLILMAISISLIYDVIYYSNSLLELFVAIPFLGLGGADFAVFTLWLPELYPTEFRGSGFAFVTSVGRFFAAAVIFGIGALALAVGFGHAVAYTAIGFIVVIPLVFLLKETKGKGLHEDLAVAK
ncbi:MAG: MFS transporter [Conexivisphaerales archaeon]